MRAFTTSQSLIVPPGTFVELKNEYPDLRGQIKKDIAAFIKNKVPDSKDYYLGTWFGEASNLLLLADMDHLDSDKAKLLSFIEPIFIKSLSYFYYDKAHTSVIAKYPEFGNENLNDHHFHYGYYIRTAAVLSSFDLSIIPKIKPTIDAMVADIATLQRDSVHYPYLRNFDVYEGHSWADGFGATPDGNNQESSSEAVNAWYSLYLWGKIDNDSSLQKTALYLYNTEIQSAYTYWFDTGNFYASPYAHAIASIVWGGKIDFATWFSDNTNMKYGIQLLPFTPASWYLGNLPDFTKYEKDFIKSGGDMKKSWGDLFTMWMSFYEPQKALLQKNRITNFQEETPRSLYLYVLYKNAEDISLQYK